MCYSTLQGIFFKSFFNLKCNSLLTGVGPREQLFIAPDKVAENWSNAGHLNLEPEEHITK